MISIIIPAYNRVSSLQKCIESILPQQYEGLEIIIIDDCSTDATKQYMQGLKQYAFIKTIYNKENRGVNYTRNRGIEAATQKFILFLDSDDGLIRGSIEKVKEAISAHPDTKHFLFVVSDRTDHFRHLADIKHISYEDWVSGAVSGDFTHVLLAEIIKKYLFFEEFRMFEHLNWLRVKKETSPQLLIPVLTTQRERDRSDSLTTSGKLKNVSVIQSRFEAEKLYYSLYHKDLNLYNPKSLTFKLVETISLGVACNQRQACRSLIGYANRAHIKVLGNLIMMLPSSFLKYGIIKYSGMKGR